MGRNFPTQHGGKAEEPCSLFRLLSGREREARGLSHGRRWGLCGHPKRVELEIAEVVCACKGCGSTCRGYQRSG